MEKRSVVSLSIKFLAVILWSFIPLFFLTLLALRYPDTILGNVFDVAFIRGEYRWDFELMFASVYFVWGIFLWKAAHNPERSKALIQFTVFANLAHGVVMTFLGILRPGEFLHLLYDSLLIVAPSLLIFFSMRSSKESGDAIRGY